MTNINTSKRPNMTFIFPACHLCMSIPMYIYTSWSGHMHGWNPCEQSQLHKYVYPQCWIWPLQMGERHILHNMSIRYVGVKWLRFPFFFYHLLLIRSTSWILSSVRKCIIPGGVQTNMSVRGILCQDWSPTTTLLTNRNHCVLWRAVFGETFIVQDGNFA